MATSAHALLALLQQRPTDQRVRALERIIPLSVVQQVLRQTGHADRHCPRLPFWLVTWMVVGLGLFAKDSYRQIFKNLQPYRPGATPGRNAIAQARAALGFWPLRLLAHRVVQLRASPATPGAFYKGLRLMALDGFVLDLPDTPANDKAFGRPGTGRAPGAFPQARVLALCEVGTHVLYRWLLKPCRRNEAPMAPYLLRWLQQGMLLLWDRAFLCHKLVAAVQARGAELLARAKTNGRFEPIEALPDGSYLARLLPRDQRRKKGREGIVVRVIDYQLDDPGRPAKEKKHRLVTTLLDAFAHPAEELIVLYHQRWEEELAIDELKTHQKERPVLRSQTPLGVVQEVEGLMLGHYAVRALMSAAAEPVGLDPRRLSFTAALKVLRCRLPEVPPTAAGRARWWGWLLAEVAEEVLPGRRNRVNPRVIKRKMSNWPKKRPQHRNPPQPTKPFRESIVIT
jgi:Insertion element 4 transposase N-terminal/Transposase DDE domain